MFDGQTLETSSLGDRSYLIEVGEVAVMIEGDGDVQAVFTGGSMLYGATACTDQP